MRQRSTYFFFFYFTSLFFTQLFAYNDVYFYSAKPQQARSTPSLPHQLLPSEVRKYRQANYSQQKNNHKKECHKTKSKKVTKAPSPVKPANHDKQNHRHIVQEIFSQTYDELENVIQEYFSSKELYDSYSPRHHYHIANRINAYEQLHNQGVIYNEKNYHLHEQSVATLAYAGYTNNAYTTFYGNQLQHTIHQEIIECLKNNNSYSHYSPLYAYQQNITDCVEAAHLYNLNGETVQALPILDFCWTLMDYGHAIGEGVINGFKGAVTDCINHPVETALCAVVGKYVLAYQLTKVLFNVAEIGATYLANPKAGKSKWEHYIEPLNTIIDALSDKQITVRDCIKSGAQLATHWKAQSVLLGGLHNFYRTTKDKAIAFARRYPLAAPQEYMQTTDGMILKASAKDLYNCNDNNVYTKNKKIISQNHSDNPPKEILVAPHNFIKNNYVPLDKETILHTADFVKTKLPPIKGASIYKKDGKFYHRDTFHTGKRAHLEVYNSKGKHLGEADPITGELFSNTADTLKKIHLH